MSEPDQATLCDVQSRLDEASAFVNEARKRSAQTGSVDLTGLEDCIRAIYDGVKAVSGVEARNLIDALTHLQRDLGALGEELTTSCGIAVAQREEPPSPRATDEAYRKADDRA